MSEMKKIKTVELDVLSDNEKDFIECASCKYSELPEMLCKARGCVHAFERLYDLFEKEQKDGVD